MSRTKAALLYILFLACLGLGNYEITAKSPTRLAVFLPGRAAAEAAERSVRWSRPTGVFALDKLLHEGREALVFYRHMLPDLDQRRGPDLSRRSSRSFSSPR